MPSADARQGAVPEREVCRPGGDSGIRPGPAGRSDYIELLPATWRKVNAYGIKIGNRTYDCKALNPYRRQHSGVNARNGLWEIHYDPYDVTRMWVRDHLGGGAGSWPRGRACGRPRRRSASGMGPRPEVLARRGRDPATEDEIARAAAALLDRAGTARRGARKNGRDRKAAARARAEAAAGPSVPARAAQPAGRQIRRQPDDGRRRRPPGRGNPPGDLRRPRGGEEMVVSGPSPPASGPASKTGGGSRP